MILTGGVRGGNARGLCLSTYGMTSQESPTPPPPPPSWYLAQMGFPSMELTIKASFLKFAFATNVLAIRIRFCCNLAHCQIHAILASFVLGFVVVPCWPNSCAILDLAWAEFWGRWRGAHHALSSWNLSLLFIGEYEHALETFHDIYWSSVELALCWGKMCESNSLVTRTKIYTATCDCAWQGSQASCAPVSFSSI